MSFLIPNDLNQAYLNGPTATSQLVTLDSSRNYIEFRLNAIATAQTLGFLVSNNTAAAAGAQQYSPVLALSGKGWRTGITAASQDVTFGLQTQPVQGSTNPTGTLAFLVSVNGAAYGTAIMNLLSRGTLQVNGQAPGSFTSIQASGDIGAVGAMISGTAGFTGTLSASGTNHSYTGTTYYVSAGANRLWSQLIAGDVNTNCGVYTGVTRVAGSLFTVENNGTPYFRIACDAVDAANKTHAYIRVNATEKQILSDTAANILAAGGQILYTL